VTPISREHRHLVKQAPTIRVKRNVDQPPRRRASTARQARAENDFIEQAVVFFQCRRTATPAATSAP